MRHVIFVLASLFLVKAWASPQDLIKSQAGCYEVAWDFVEDQVFIPNYPTVSKPYHEKGMEWVTVDHDEQNRVSLQHILMAGGELQKHWRQEWLYQEPTHLNYYGRQLWKTEQAHHVEGSWQRRVLQVDDSPRDECYGAWDETAKTWSCKVWSPPPRRESMRHDYNVLLRGNTHQITPTGWILAEDNTKLNVTTDGKVTQIAHEKGTNTYTRVPDSRCQVAQDWWVVNQPAWEKVQSVWSSVRVDHPVLQFSNPADQGPLYGELFDIVDTAVQAKTVETPKFLQDVQTAILSYLQ